MVVQPLEALVALVAVQQAVPNKDIKDELGADFKAHGETTKDKADKVDETKLPELLAKEDVKIGLPAVLII